MDYKGSLTLQALIIASTLSISGNTNAQDATTASKEELPLEEVVVQAIRTSLERSAQIKRESSAMLEALTAEGLGKFPDTNIAEALQRVPGITIDRNGGEGQFVTVRGFGPSFNTVLVNGRRLASEIGNREFSFDLFPSELISGSTVYKSGTAHLQEGGIGATIDLKTLHPLDKPGFQSAVVLRGLYDSNSSETTPQFFALASNTFADDTLGVMGAISYQERESEILTFNNRGVISGLVSDLDPAVNVTNPTDSERFFMSQNLQLGQTLQTRKRTNVQGAFQWAPNDQVMVTIDGMWNDFTLESESRFINTWFSLTDLDNLVLDNNGTVLRVDQNGNGGIEARAQNDGRPTQTTLLGFNIQWDPSEKISHHIDLSLTGSENKPQTSDTGQSVIGFRSPYTYVNDGSTTYPFTQFTIPAEQVRDTSAYRFHVSQYGGDGDSKEAGNVVDSELNELRYDGVFYPGTNTLRSIKFGFNYGQESKDVDIMRTDQTALCTYCGFFVDVPDNLESQLLFPVRNDLLSQGDGGFVDINGQILSAYLGNTVVGDTTALQTAELLALRDRVLGLPTGTSQTQFETLGGFANQRRPESFSIDEDIFAFYVDFDLEGEVGSMPWSINTGLRYVETRTKASGTDTPLEDIVLNEFDTTEYLQVLGDLANASVKRSNSYTTLLPNINVRLEITESVTVRAGLSETMSRPQLTDLSPRLAILNTRPNNLVAVGGNPNLKPFESINFDLGVEYYLDDFSYIALAAFRKEVDNFIVQTTAREALTITNSDNISDDPRISGTTASFDVTRPTNAETAKVQGIELSGQYLFSFLPGALDGLGFIGNLLIVDSDAEVGQNTGERTNFGLPGLSDALNAQIFYSKHNWDARISYSKREAFLETLSNVIGGEPVFVETFEQIDFKVSYTLADSDITVFVEGLNITDEDIRKTGRFANQFIEATNTGPRYAVGVSTSF